MYNTSKRISKFVYISDERWAMMSSLFYAMIVINFKIPSCLISVSDMRSTRTRSSGTVENSASRYSAISRACGKSKHKSVICPMFGASPNRSNSSQREIVTVCAVSVAHNFSIFLLCSVRNSKYSARSSWGRFVWLGGQEGATQQNKLFTYDL